MFQFEVSNWHTDNARTLAQASYDAQANAVGLTPDDTTFLAMADTIDAMLTNLGVSSDTPVYISAQAQVVGNELSNLNLGFKFG